MAMMVCGENSFVRMDRGFSMMIWDKCDEAIQSDCGTLDFQMNVVHCDNGKTNDFLAAEIFFHCVREMLCFGVTSVFCMETGTRAMNAAWKPRGFTKSATYKRLNNSGGI